MLSTLLIVAALAAEPQPLQIDARPLSGGKATSVAPSAVAAAAVERGQMQTKASLTPSGAVRTWCEQTEPAESVERPR